MGCGSSSSATPVVNKSVNGSAQASSKKPPERKTGRKVRPASTDRDKAVEASAKSPTVRREENPKINVQDEAQVEASIQKTDAAANEIVENQSPNPEVDGEDADRERDPPEGCASYGKAEKVGGAAKHTDDPGMAKEGDENKEITMATEEEKAEIDQAKQSVDESGQSKEGEGKGEVDVKEDTGGDDLAASPVESKEGDEQHEVKPGTTTTTGEAGKAECQTHNDLSDNDEKAEEETVEEEAKEKETEQEDLERGATNDGENKDEGATEGEPNNEGEADEGEADEADKGEANDEEKVTVNEDGETTKEPKGETPTGDEGETMKGEEKEGTEGEEAKPAEPSKGDEEEMKTEIKQEGERITEATVERFLALEVVINNLTKDNVISRVKTAEGRMQAIASALVSSDERLKVLQAMVAQEFQDVVRLQGASLQGLVVHNYEQQLSKEEQEYYAALNEHKLEERRKKVLEMQYNRINEQVAVLRSQVDELKNREEEREEMLCQIFDGDYGSEKEQGLELKVNLLVVKHGQVKTAHFQWCNARVLLEHAIKQMHYGICKWVEMRRIHPASREVLYRVATEARNLLAASSQNVWSARQYIPPELEVPYCNNYDMNKLNAAISTLYNDMLYQPSHRASYDLFNQAYHRMCLFHQWVTHVVDSNISKELALITKRLKKKKKRLLKERKRIMMAMINGEDRPEESTTESEDEKDDVSMEDGGELNPDGGPAEAEAISVSSEPTADEPETASKPEEGESDAADIPDFQPIPMSELAPAPSQEQVIGSVGELMKQHQDELEDFNKAKEKNKARAEQDLKEKLRQRRSRKQKLQMQAEQEKMATQASGDKKPEEGKEHSGDSPEEDKEEDKEKDKEDGGEAGD